MANDSKSMRLSDETKARFDKVTKENFANAEEALTAILDVYDLDQAATTKFGQSLKADIASFRKYADGLITLYTNSITRGDDAVEIATQKVQNRLESQETTILAMKNELAAAKEQAKAAEQAKAEAEARAAEAEKRLEGSQETVTALKAAVDTLNRQLEATKVWVNAIKAVGAAPGAVAPKELERPEHNPENDETSLFEN